jgi:hypothetical protein
MDDTTGLVLYVGRDATSGEGECPGSRQCLALVDAQCVPCTVQHVETLYEAGVEIPNWLDGTPLLVDAVSRQAFKGTQAVAFLEGAARASAEAVFLREAEVAAGAARAARAAPLAPPAPPAPPAPAGPPRGGGPGPGSGRAAPAALGGGGHEVGEDEGEEDDVWGQAPPMDAVVGSHPAPGKGMPPPVAHEPTRGGGVTEDDLQRYMDARIRTGGVEGAPGGGA